MFLDDTPEHKAMQEICHIANAMPAERKMAFLRYLINWAENALPYVEAAHKAQLDRRARA